MIFSRNDIKVSFSKEHYQTVGKTIKCELTYKVKIPAFDHADKDGVEACGCFIFPDQKVVGMANCNSEDQFNKKTGREIACARAEAKAYQNAKKMVEKFLCRVVTNYADMATKFIDRADYIKRHNAEYVAEMGGQK